MVGGRPMKIEIVDMSIDAIMMLDDLEKRNYSLEEIAKAIGSKRSFLYGLRNNPIGRPTYKRLKAFYEEVFFGAV